MKNFIKISLGVVALVCLSVFTACSEDPTPANGDFTYVVNMDNSLKVSFEASGFGDYVVWDFGDGETSTSLRPVHTYATGGDYVVTLNIYREEVSKPTPVTKMVSVVDSPEAAFTYEAEYLEVTFTSTTQFADAYYWEFGDGGTSTEENPVHTYSEAGEYTVTFTATGAEGSVPATASATITVQDLPFTAVTLENGDFELPAAGRLADWADIPGWDSDAATVDSGVEQAAWWSAGNETYSGVLFTGDTSAYNQTTHSISEGEEFKLQFEAVEVWNGPKITAAIVYVASDGTRNVLASQTFDVVSGAWTDIELTAKATVESVGGRLGIEFKNISGDGSDGWTGFDNVKLLMR